MPNELLTNNMNKKAKFFVCLLQSEQQGLKKMCIDLFYMFCKWSNNFCKHISEEGLKYLSQMSEQRLIKGFSFEVYNMEN